MSADLKRGLSQVCATVVERALERNHVLSGCFVSLDSNAIGTLGHANVSSYTSPNDIVDHLKTFVRPANVHAYVPADTYLEIAKQLFAFLNDDDQVHTQKVFVAEYTGKTRGTRFAIVLVYNENIE